MSDNTSSRYMPLNTEKDEIRVLSLEPGPTNSTDTISCRLEVISIKQLGTLQEPLREKWPAYETISYCWGNAKERAFVRLDGHLIDVPRSSEAALRRMRFQDRERILWIDAICIDQGNVPERSHQVTIMAQVFRGGQQNLVYLGEADKFTERALQSIQTLMNTEIADATSDGKSLVDTLWKGNEMLYSDTGFSVKYDQEALMAFYSRPWFGRLWVLQEMSLARGNLCICGPFEANMNHVLMVAQWLRFKLLYLEHPLQTSDGMLIASHMFDFAGGPHAFFGPGRAVASIADMLITARIFECMDPRDKVFAILGLVDWGANDQIPDECKPDYERNLSEVLAGASYFAMKKLPSVRWVAHRSTEDMHLDGLPSWVPRWHRRLDTEMDPTPLARLGSSPGISCTLRLESSTTDEFTIMEVEGFTIDVVTFVYEACNNNTRYQQWISSLRELFDTYDVRDDIVCHILTAGAWMLRSITPENLRIVNEVVHSLERGEDIWNYHHTTNLEPWQIDQCGKCFREACTYRRICRTERNLPTLVPLVAEASDLVVQILGSPTPCVLRFCGEGRYEVVGPAYVYGMMHGEALEEWRAKGGVRETFRLI